MGGEWTSPTASVTVFLVVAMVRRRRLKFHISYFGINEFLTIRLMGSSTRCMCICSSSNSSALSKGSWGENGIRSMISCTSADEGS